MRKKRILELQEEIFKLGEEEEKRLLDNLKEEFLNTKITWCYNKLDQMNKKRNRKKESNRII